MTLGDMLDKIKECRVNDYTWSTCKLDHFCWVFCDENCAYCVNNLITTTNATITTSEYKIDS